MDTLRIAELLNPYLDPADHRRLTANDLQNISMYIDILKQWNARINLTAIRNDEDIVTRHFGESLFAARHLFPSRVAPGILEVRAERAQSAASESRTGPTEQDSASVLHMPADQIESRNDRGRATLQSRVGSINETGALAPVTKLADVGSGAGFPGIPMKIWAPGIAVTLIESNNKKVAFLREVARALTLMGINITSARAETLPAGTFDLVTLRAVERFQAVLPIAARLVRPGGRLALLIGAAQLPTATSVISAWDWLNPLPIPLSQSRILAVASNPGSLGASSSGN